MNTMEPTEILSMYPPDQYTMLRGFPRRKTHVEEVEKGLGGKLVPDTKPDLILQLDNYLYRARMEMGKYPDYIAIPGEPMALFVPIPFEMYWYNMTLNSYHKPAWIQVNRTISMPALSWTK